VVTDSKAPAHPFYFPPSVSRLSAAGRSRTALRILIDAVELLEDLERRNLSSEAEKRAIFEMAHTFRASYEDGYFDNP
jgi:hypothetical protein